jgi:hypothetical protein
MNSRKRVLFAASAAFLALLLTCVLGEILTRVFLKDEINPGADERTLCYRYDSELGWFPVENGVTEFNASRLIHVRNNGDGFRDRPHGPKTKKRLAVVGDSSVWGYDVEANERFTEKLQSRLPDWEVLNLGVSGYGTDQELLILRKWFDRYQPDLVLLVFSDNDMVEDRLNIIHGGYYKPYFESVGQTLVLRGIPVPKCLRYYRLEHPLLFKSALAQALLGRYLAWRVPEHFCVQNLAWPLLESMKHYVESKGAKFVVGFVSDYRGGKKFSVCEQLKVDYLLMLDPADAAKYSYPAHGNHWTPDGHDLVCERLCKFLVSKHYLAMATNKAPP